MSVQTRHEVPSTPLPAQPDGVPFPTQAWDRAEPRPDIELLADRVFETPDDGPFGMSLAVVVVQHGRLVFERYGPTAGVDEPLVSWSMAKSIAHALVGILVGEGRLDVAAPARVPEWAGDGRRDITLDHLLRMVPGVEFNEDYVDDQASHCIDMLFGSGSADMGAYAATLPAVAGPDRVFNYSSGTTNLICRIMADIVGAGDAFADWARDALFEPIGMDSADPRFDDAGTWVGSSFLYATARDFAKFGLLYLRDGVWDQQRILPEGWVDYARTPRAVDDDGSTYGAHWWIWDPDSDVFGCQGYECQRILVDPGSDAVVVRLGKTPIEKAPAVDTWLHELLGLLRVSHNST